MLITPLSSLCHGENGNLSARLQAGHWGLLLPRGSFLPLALRLSALARGKQEEWERHWGWGGKGIASSPLPRGVDSHSSLQVPPGFEGKISLKPGIC